MPDLTFRDATAADLPIILALCTAGDARGPDAPYVDPASYADPRYLKAFQAIVADPAHRLIVAEHGGEVIGTLQISVVPGLPKFGMTRGILENVHIRADQRGTGFGGQMLRWAIEICRVRGCDMVQLTSNKIRTEAHRFYRTLGFQQTHEGFKLQL